MLNTNRTVVALVECPHCESSGNEHWPDVDYGVRCKRCGGTGEVKPHCRNCGDQDPNHCFSEEDAMDKLSGYADQAIECVTRIEAAIDLLKIERDLLTELLAKAADLPAVPGQRDARADMLTLWRLTIDSIDRAILATRGKP